jgi:uncharacterized repeat protein (TIGR03803 family)
LDGNFYGVTTSGGANGGGTVFQVTPSGAMTVLYACGAGQLINAPYTSLAQASDGTLYGAAFGGPVYSFSNATDLQVISTLTVGTITSGSFFGPNPVALIVGSDGNLYGTSNMGGVGAASEGAIFKVQLH